MLLSLVFAASAPPAVAGEIVSLGDSYSSGEAAGPYDADTDERGAHKCHRSSKAWPRLIGVSRDLHLACSGAVVDNVTGGKPQLSTGPDSSDQITRLAEIAGRTVISRVVMTIGGNDMKFGPRIKSCYLFGRLRCLNDRAQIKRELATLRTRLTTMYTQVRDAAQAPLLVVGYPDIFPDRSERHRCSWLDPDMQARFARFSKDLDETTAAAARAAGVDYVSTRDTLDGHELCTGRSYVRSIVGKPGDLLGDQQQAHPLYEGQLAIAERVVRWLVENRPACSPASSVAAIVDDSGSMSDNDPENIRRRAMELILTKPANQSRTFSGVEFGTDAGSLFGPAPAGTAQTTMLASLASLKDDGFTDGGNTDYNEAFRNSAALHPAAGARIFLTDGGHNQGSYEDVHAGGPATYVIGLNIGPADGGDDAAQLLSRIASETGGRYFPLRLVSGDGPATQLARLQPALNEIDTRIGCAAVQAESRLAIGAAGRSAGSFTSLFRGQPGMEIIISWSDPDVDIDVGAMTARDRKGRVVGDLTGKRRIAGSKRRRAKLVVSTLEGRTFDTISLRRPAYGRTLTLTLKAPGSAAGIPATIQIRPTDAAPSQGGTTEVPSAGSPTSSPTPAPSPPAVPPPAPTPPTPPAPPAPPRKIITVDNRVTNGLGMREDATPARLTTQAWVYCGSRGCNINGTERSSGGTYDAAVCQTTGERTTNGNDGSAVDDANPELFSSTRYYGVRLSSGTFGYVSEVWIRAADRGGLGLPAC